MFDLFLICRRGGKTVRPRKPMNPHKCEITSRNALIGLNFWGKLENYDILTFYSTNYIFKAHLTLSLLIMKMKIITMMIFFSLHLKLPQIPNYIHFLTKIDFYFLQIYRWLFYPCWWMNWCLFKFDFIPRKMPKIILFVG